MRNSILMLAGSGLASAYTVVVNKHFMFKNIDPVVLPGTYNSHMHSFFGSDAVTVNTNSSEELQAGCSTAENPNDFSIYWVPTLYHVEGDSRTPIIPGRFSAYYINIEHAEVAIPQDYKTVVGNAKGKTQADVEDLAGIQWMCEGDPAEEKDLAAFPSKGCSTMLQTLLLFHDCVNEETLESAYSGTQNWKDGFKPANRCPAGMKRMPQLRFSIRYDLRKVIPGGWSGPAPLELACGPSYCSHGDFIMGWLPEAAEDMLKCTDKREFRDVQGPISYAQKSNCVARDADPSHGTSDYAQSVAMMQKRDAERHRRSHVGRRR